MKEKLYKTGFQVRPKGAKDAWARVLLLISAPMRKGCQNFGGAMKKFTAHLALSRRSAIKGAAAVAAGAAAPTLLRIRSAYAAYPDRPVKIVVADTPSGHPVGWPRDHRRASTIDR